MALLCILVDVESTIGVAVGSLVLLEERGERRHVAFVQSVHSLRARVVRLNGRVSVAIRW